MRRPVRPVLLLLLLCPAVVLAAAVQVPAPDPARFEEDIRAFEEADRRSPPPTGGIVFVGSSSIRLWKTLQEDFPGLPVVNRGFGGSQLPEVIAFADRIVLPYRPRLVVVYAGANDIAGGRTPAQVAADFTTLVGVIQEQLPDTRVAFISIAPNPARWDQVDRVRAANRAVQTWASRRDDVEYIDVFSQMLGPDGRPKPDIFVEDRLHMNGKGYAIWTTLVAPHLAPALAGRP